MPLNCEQILKFVDKPVGMAKFGRDQVKKMYNVNTGYIPHAVEVDNYYPLPDIDKQKLKEKWGLNGKFVVGTVARNQGRKMMDRTLKAFAIYAKKDPNAILFMHTDPNDAAQVFSMGNLINRYQLQNRVVFTGTTYFSGFDYKKMNEVYNVMDVFLLTTSGEGFGIPIIEAMACEVPVLATNYTTTKELVLDHNAGLGINLVGVDPLDHPDVHTNEILDGTITGSWDVERGICSITDCSIKLEWLRNHPKEMEIMGKNGRKAVLKYYDWNVVDKDWLKVIEELGDEY